MLAAVTRIKAHTHTHTMPVLLGVYVLACMSVYLHKRKTNPAHNLSVLCAQHHTVLHTEFAEWKAAYEAEHDVMFVKSTGYKATDGCTTSYYQCNRSGVFHPEGSGQKRLKSHGSSKIYSQSHCAQLRSH